MLKLSILAWYNDPIDQIKVAIDALARHNVETRSVDASTLLVQIEERRDLPDAILIWNRHQGMDLFPRIRPLFSGKIIFFNWDDPHAINRSNLKTKVNQLDHVFSSCRSTEDCYLRMGVKSWSYLPPFYDPSWHYPEYDSRYAHDVALVCTNLYQDCPNQLVSRYDLVKALDADPDIDFGLYGPDSIKVEFPNSYRGFVSYSDNHRVFTSSTISISTHVEDGDGYINERCICILASGGLLLRDPIEGVDLPGSLKMESSNIETIMTQIKKILHNPNIRRHHVEVGMKEVGSYHVDEWAKVILSSL